MAFYQNNEDEEENSSQGMNNKNEEQKTAPVQLSSQTGTVSSTTSVPSPKAPKSASSGSAPGFQNYMSANQGKAQDKLNSAVSGNVAGIGKQAQNSINQATTQFNQQADKGALGGQQSRDTAVQDVSNVVNTARNATAPAGNPAVAAQNNAQQVPTLGTHNLTQEQALWYDQNVDRENGTINTSQTGKIGTPESFQTPPAAETSPFDPMNVFDQSQKDRFSEIINAQYKGPESLRQAGLYQLASGKVQNAQDTLNNTKTATGREELLRNMYQQRGDYTSGLNKLDSALLNASKQGVQNLQNVAQQQGNLGQKLDQAQISSAATAQNRASEVSNIQEQARKAFSEGKTAEEAATENRLKELIGVDAEGNLDGSNWNALPEYLKNIIREGQGGANFNSFEADLLGVKSGEGLYNLGENAIKVNQYDKNKLISRDEQLRQAALASLAGLDQSNRLDTNLLYDNAALAGTQSSADALDLEGTRAALNSAEQDFRNTAEGTNLTGQGSKKVSRGNTFGKKTKTYNASVGGNVGDFLEQAGYNLDSEIGSGQSNIANQKSLLNAALQASDTNRTDDANDALASAAGSLASGTIDPTQNLTGVLDEYLPGVGTAIQDGRNLAGDLYSDLGQYNPINLVGDQIGKALGLGSLTGGISGAISGIDTGAMKSYGSAIAKEQAIRDLQNQYSGFLDNQGFDNRVGVVNNEATTSRLSALQELLANMDKTNT